MVKYSQYVAQSFALKNCATSRMVHVKGSDVWEGSEDDDDWLLVSDSPETRDAVVIFLTVVFPLNDELLMLDFVISGFIGTDDTRTGIGL